MKNMFFWISSALAVILVILLAFQLKLLLFPQYADQSSLHTYNGSSIDLPHLALQSKEEIITKLGNPKKIRHGYLASGKIFEEFVYPHNDIMITFVNNKASRFSVAMERDLTFPEDAKKALQKLSLPADASPNLKNDGVLKWEKSINNYPVVSIINKNGQIDYVNIIVE